MGEGGNVFNTFSFKRWADSKKEEMIDQESKKKRNEQMKRLKDKLRKERELREQGLGGEGDMDLDALIEAIRLCEASDLKGEVIVEVDGYDEDSEDDIPVKVKKKEDKKIDVKKDPKSDFDYYLEEVIGHPDYPDFDETKIVKIGSAKTKDVRPKSKDQATLANTEKISHPPLSWKFNRRVSDNDFNLNRPTLSRDRRGSGRERKVISHSADGHRRADSAKQKRPSSRSFGN